MRINTEVFKPENNRIDAFGEVKIPNCEPKQLCTVTEKLMQMIIDRDKELDATPYQYNSVTELDKRLMIDYWCKYDNMSIYINSLRDYEEWFISRATNPELLRRARQWLVSHRYIFLNPDVAESAQEAGNKFRKAVRG